MVLQFAQEFAVVAVSIGQPNAHVITRWSANSSCRPGMPNCEIYSARMSVFVGNEKS